MPSYRVNVLRNPPRRRDICSGLTGRLEVSIVAESYLHIGEGAQKSLVEIDEEGLKGLKGAPSLREVRRYVRFIAGVVPFNKVSGKPAIPGGTVKGNIRTRLELSFRSKNGVARSCLLIASRPLDRPNPPRTSGWRHQRIWSHAIGEDRRACNFIAERKVCLLCDLFGSAGLSSLINFSDFLLTDGANRMEIVDLPYGMRLEAAKPGSVFTGIIEFRNLALEELGLLFLGMGLRGGRISDQVLMGRLKYHNVQTLGGKVFGRIRYRLNGLALSRLSTESMKLDGWEIRPGGSLADEGRLDALVKDLVDRSLKKFEGEIMLVDEVRVIDQLPRA